MQKKGNKNKKKEINCNQLGHSDPDQFDASWKGV